MTPKPAEAKGPIAFVLLVVLLVGSIAAYSESSPQAQTSISASSGCSQPSGVGREQLGAPSQFGQVTTYQLPRPLRAPNSIAVAPDGSVWFGEVGLRGVAHLFTNGTLLEYAWPSSAIAPQANCYDILDLWGIALWHGMVWASGAADDQLLGLVPYNDTFVTIHLANGTAPRFLAVDDSGDLWFTEASTPTSVGVLDSPRSAPRYFSVPAAQGEISASLLIYNSTLAYVVTVNPSNNSGEVFSFDPAADNPVFSAVGTEGALLGPYSAAVGSGGLWVSEHDSSDLASYNRASSEWDFFPTSVLRDVALTLPYYMVGNGSSVWFTEQTGNRIGEVSGNSVTEFNISSRSMAKSGIENALTLAVRGSLVWFTEWTGNAIGYVNASINPSFSVAPLNGSAATLAPGSSSTLSLVVSGTSALPLSLQFSDSETHSGIPVNLTIGSSPSSIDGLSGTAHLLFTFSAREGTPAGDYLVLATVTDGITYRSVYLTVTVS